MRETHKLITDAYEDITSAKNKYGKFHKTLFHLHTPASHDYRFIEHVEGKTSRIWKDYSLDEIKKICLEKKVYTIGSEKEFFAGLEEKMNIFSSVKEALIYILIANELFIYDYELVVISDHNTIDGYDKMVAAVTGLYYKNYQSRKNFPEIVLGVEISCADKNHVVGILDYKEKNNREALKKYLNDEFLNEVEGTYHTSLDVIKKIYDLNGIAYIAHVNTSDMFKEEKFLSHAYKKELFSSDKCQLLGVTHVDQIEATRKRIQSFRNTDIPFVIDSDSHAIDTIQEKFFWIKGTKCDFQMIKEALTDADICIKLVLPSKPECYMKGLLLRNTSKSFLTAAPQNKDFCISFSEELNCFIGGRGSGKSTVINILECVLRQYFYQESMLDVIFQYDYVWILYQYKHEEYLVAFFPRSEDNGENSVPDSYYNMWRQENLPNILPQNALSLLHLNRHAYFYENGRRLCNNVLNDCIRIYKIVGKLQKKIEYEEVRKNRDKKELLGKFLGQTYSINELVQTSQRKEKVNEYIYKTLRSNKIISDCPIKNFRAKSGLIEHLNSIEKIVEKHEKDVNQFVTKFNHEKKLKDKLRIIYTRDEKMCNFIHFEKYLNKRIVSTPICVREKGVLNYLYCLSVGKIKYNWEYDNFIEYLYSCCEKLGLVDFFHLVLLEKEEELIKQCPIDKFLMPYEKKLIDNGVEEISDKNKVRILRHVMKELWESGEKSFIESFKQPFITQGDKFTLEFNVCNREGEKGHKFKNITELSMGQKVVAMVTFVLAYSEYNQDYRPLIMDQPEDNLDSQYIYKNLVAELRDVKSKRQVIIATHNATIVTNAKAGQVIVLESDGAHGWIKACGYPNEKRIKTHIINYLEGGVDSFLHKQAMYAEILNNKRI